MSVTWDCPSNSGHVMLSPRSQLPGPTEYTKPQLSVAHHHTDWELKRGFWWLGLLVKVQTNRTWLTGESRDAPCWGQQGGDECPPPAGSHPHSTPAALSGFSKLRRSHKQNTSSLNFPLRRDFLTYERKTPQGRYLSNSGKKTQSLERPRQK